MERSVYRQRARKYIDDVCINMAKAIARSSDIPEFEEFKLLSLHRVIQELDTESHKYDVQRTFEDVIILERYLTDTILQENDKPTEAAIAVIRRTLSTAILPSEDFAFAPAYAPSPTPKMSTRDIAMFHAMSSHALFVLARLGIEPPISDSAIYDDVALLAGISSLTDLSDPWTCESSQKAALDLLKSIMDDRDLEGRSQALSVLLRQKIRPAFSKTRDPATTPQARKVVDPLPMHSSLSAGMEDTAAPWKYHEPSIVTVLRWTLGSLGLVNDSFVEINWPLLIPPVLALIDDSSTAYKKKGCGLLKTLLPKVPAHLLERAGLGDVFEKSLLPCLMYLPSMTNEDESLSLLDEAYPALISLARTRFKEPRDRRIEAMDRVLRSGILRGYAQAGEHVKIANSLVMWMQKVVLEMGIDIVPCLKRLLSLLLANLTAPFALAYPPLLMSSLRTLQTIILIAWPRVPHHRAKILTGLTVCWNRIEEHESRSQELGLLQQSLQTTAKTLRAVLMRTTNAVKEFQAIVDGDQRLRGLLSV